MLDGNLNDKIYLRGKDEAVELSLMFNDFNLQLSEKISSMLDITKAVEAQLTDEGEEAIDIAEIRKLNANLNEMLAGFILMEK